MRSGILRVGRIITLNSSLPVARQGQGGVLGPRENAQSGQSDHGDWGKRAASSVSMDGEKLWAPQHRAEGLQQSAGGGRLVSRRRLVA